MKQPTLHFEILGSNFSVAGATPRFSQLVTQNFSAYRSGPAEETPFFLVQVRPAGGIELRSIRSGVIWETGPHDATTTDDYEFLYALEKDLTLELQRARSDLYFVHAAVLARGERCILISAASGTGKSTLAYALQSSGFFYMSDELAPLNTATCSVYPYLHALCLKSIPPDPFDELPPHVATARTVHIPTDNLNAVTSQAALPLAALIFLQRNGEIRIPCLSPISPAEAAARLYGNTLNALAHPDAGIGAAVAIASRLPAWRLDAGDLTATCKLLHELNF